MSSSAVWSNSVTVRAANERMRPVAPRIMAPAPEPVAAQASASIEVEAQEPEAHEHASEAFEAELDDAADSVEVDIAQDQPAEAAVESTTQDVVPDVSQADEEIAADAAPALPPSPAAKRAPATPDFELIIEDPDEVSTGPVSVEELEDDAFDLTALLDDESTQDSKGTQAPPARPPRDFPQMADVDDDEMRKIVEDEPASRAPVETSFASAPMPRQVADAASDVDDDILEIFVEEVGEVLERVDQWLPQWATEFANEEALTEVRRAFHTLKGSGRIVGANVIGELAWSVENMLNRVMDGTVEPNHQIAAVVREARGAVPALCQAFENRRGVSDSHYALIMEKADVLASGGRLEELAEERPAHATNEPIRAAPVAEEDRQRCICAGRSFRHGDARDGRRRRSVGVVRAGSRSSSDCARRTFLERGRDWRRCPE